MNRYCIISVTVTVSVYFPINISLQKHKLIIEGGLAKKEQKLVNVLANKQERENKKKRNNITFTLLRQRQHTLQDYRV